MGQQDFTFQTGQQREFGARTPLPEHPQQPRTPSALKQSLGLKVTAMLPVGKTERFKFQTLPVVGDCYRGVHGKLSFYF